MIFTHAIYINLVKITNLRLLVHERKEKANITNIVPMHANAYRFQKNLPKGMLNTREHENVRFPSVTLM